MASGREGYGTALWNLGDMETRGIVRLWARVVLAWLGLWLLPVTVQAGALTPFTQRVVVGGRTFPVTGVRVDLRDPGITLKVGLAWGHIGRTESLGAIAQRYHALAAINGSFFDAYTSDTLKNPDMSLITDGTLAFKSDIGSLLGFEADNTPHFARVRYRLVGTVRRAGARPQSWFAYWVNRKPTADPCVTLFTPLWGPRVEGMAGTSIVVQDGVVTAITEEPVVMPAMGYVLHIRGEAGLRARFQVGDQVTFTPEVALETGDASAADWAKVREAVGAGPRVLLHGTPLFDPRSERFADPKILERSGARSAVGLTADQQLLLVTVRGARVADLGRILSALGCLEGMNLDGGASSGLWAHGAYLTTPGRAISNALLVVKR